MHTAVSSTPRHGMLLRTLGETTTLGINANDTNLYRYVGNDATNLIDPSGMVGLPTDNDSPSRKLWEAIRTKNWQAAKDIADDLIKCVQDPRARRALQGLRDGIKQMQNLDKWRKQWDKKSLSEVRDQAKRLAKTLEQHLEKRKGIDTPETQRIRYQIDYLKRRLGEE